MTAAALCFVVAILLWLVTGRDPGWWLARFGCWLSGVLNALPYAIRAGYAALKSQAAVVRASGEGRAPKRAATEESA